MEVKNSARAFFESLRDLDKEIEAKFEQLERLRSLATKVTAIMPEVAVKRTGFSLSAENPSDKIVDLENELKADVARLIDLKSKAYAIIGQIKNVNYRIALGNRYLNCDTVEKVGEKLGCSTYWARETIKAALTEAEKIMKKAE